jgi:hypothetical protein
VVRTGAEPDLRLLLEKMRHLGSVNQECADAVAVEPIAYGVLEIGPRPGGLRRVFGTQTDPAGRAEVPPTWSVFSTRTTSSPRIAPVSAAVMPCAQHHQIDVLRSSVHFTHGTGQISVRPMSGDPRRPPANALDMPGAPRAAGARMQSAARQGTPEAARDRSERP